MSSSPPRLRFPISPHYHVWRSAEALENGTSSLVCQYQHHDCDDDPSTRREQEANDRWGKLLAESASILRIWGGKWEHDNMLQSFLNKPSMLHEVEEAIVALYFLLGWLSGFDCVVSSTSEAVEHTAETAAGGGAFDGLKEDVTVVDMCCGKGVFSMLLAYLAARSTFQHPLRCVRGCVMVDKAGAINWNHIDAANRDVASGTSAIYIDTWGGCNIHDEEFIDRLRPDGSSLGKKIAIVGIHLCKNLGPRCIGIFNSLGTERAPFLCLAPCCMPRLSKKCKIRVARFEGNLKHEDRLRQLQLRRNACQGHDSCLVCGRLGHRVRDCPRLPTDDTRVRLSMIKAAYDARAPCWRCGEIGHKKWQCTTVQKSCRPCVSLSPSVYIDMNAILDTPSPFETYCSRLADVVQGPVRKKELKVVPLIGNDKQCHRPDHKRNWNGMRKCTWLVVER